MNPCWRAKEILAAQQVYKQEIGTLNSLFNVLNIKVCFTKKGMLNRMTLGVFMVLYVMPSDFFIPTGAKKQTGSTLEADKSFPCESEIR